MALDIRGPNLKLDRVQRHINELNAILGELLNANRDTISVEADADPDLLLCVSHAKLDLPEHVPLVIGDAIHNIHAAWDHLANLLVKPKGALKSKTQFPFAATVQRFECELLDRGFIGRCSPTVLDAIRGIAPHNDVGGNHGLYALHRLDILDKHRLIIAVAEPMIVVPYVGIKGRSMRVGTQVFGPENGRIVCRIPGRANTKVGDKLTPGIGIFFGQGIPLAGQPVLKTLSEYTDYSRKIVASFAPFI